MALAPGEETQVSFTLTARDLSYYDEELGDWYAAPGRYAELVHALDTLPTVKRAEFKLIADPYDFY